MTEVLFYTLMVFIGAWLPPICIKRLHHKPKTLRAISYASLLIYMLGNLYQTILFRAAKPYYTAEWLPFWSYREALALESAPGGVLDVVIGLIKDPRGAITITDSGLLAEIFLNILLYIPLGYLLPFVWPKVKRYQKLLDWRLIGIGLLLSCLTEICQLVFRIGLFEFDDIINNTLGCLIGCAAYGLMEKGKLIPQR